MPRPASWRVMWKVRGTAEGAGPMRRTRVVAARVDASMLTTCRFAILRTAEF